MNWRAFLNAAWLAVQTIRAHKMRAFLTVLGVVMGTGTIIGVGAILTGFDTTMESMLSSFGPNSIIVFKFPAGIHGPLTPEERTRKNITYQNAVDIREKCNACDEVSPMLFVNRNTIEARYKGNDTFGISFLGVEESYASEGQADMNKGRFVSDSVNRRRAAVAVIGADLEKSLYANVDPLNKPITVDGHEYTVIGTMNRPAASFFGQNDMRVILPYFTMQKNYPASKEMGIVVNAKTGQLPSAIDQVRVILRVDRRVPYSKPDDFALSTDEQMV